MEDNFDMVVLGDQHYDLFALGTVKLAMIYDVILTNTTFSQKNQY